MTVQETG